MAYTLAEKEGRTRPQPTTTEVKSTLGFTSDFCLTDKGWTHVSSLPLCALYRKNGKLLVQWRGREWKRQRDEDFYRLHGMTREEYIEWRKTATSEQLKPILNKYGCA